MQQRRSNCTDYRYRRALTSPGCKKTWPTRNARCKGASPGRHNWRMEVWPRGRVTAEALDMMEFQLEIPVGDRQGPRLQLSPRRSRIHPLGGEEYSSLVLVALHPGAVRAEAP